MIKRILEGVRDEKVVAETGRQVGKPCREFYICGFFGKKREAE
jgi:hypothetical protein